VLGERRNVDRPNRGIDELKAAAGPHVAAAIAAAPISVLQLTTGLGANTRPCGFGICDGSNSSSAKLTSPNSTGQWCAASPAAPAILVGPRGSPSTPALSE
jgi:hypothetical protein